MSRDTQRVAIFDYRLVDVVDNQVSFTRKYYRHKAHLSLMTLSPAEFVHYFLLHVLPDGFQRIRHYGFRVFKRLW